MAHESPNRPDDSTSIVDVVQYVKRYAEQETVGPLKGAVKWIRWGAAGAIAYGLGLCFILLGLLRLLQTEWSLSNAWNWAHYLIVFVAALLACVVAFLQTRKPYLNKEHQ